MKLSLLIGAGLIFGALNGAAQAAPVSPSFTTGTVTSHTESTTTVNESIRQTTMATGWTYTVTGTNIDIPESPALGMSYTQINPGEAFQFSETYMGPGITGITEIERTITTNTVTDSLSVFTQ